MYYESTINTPAKSKPKGLGLISVTCNAHEHNLDNWTMGGSSRVCPIGREGVVAGIQVSLFYSLR